MLRSVFGQVKKPGHSHLHWFHGAAVSGLGAVKPETIACAPFSLTEMIPWIKNNILFKAKHRYWHTLWALLFAGPAAPPGRVNVNAQ